MDDIGQAYVILSDFSFQNFLSILDKKKKNLLFCFILHLYYQRKVCRSPNKTVGDQNYINQTKQNLFLATKNYTKGFCLAFANFINLMHFSGNAN